MIPSTDLRQIRNEIDIAVFIHRGLRIYCKVSEGRFRFLCPVCHEMNTATNPKTNLARCFRCERNFNVIDLTMLVSQMNFTEAIAFLRPFLMKHDFRHRHEHGNIMPQRSRSPESLPSDPEE